MNGIRLIASSVIDKLSPVWDSIDSLSAINYWAQLISVALILGTFFVAAASLIATFRKDALQRTDDLAKSEEIARTSKLAADANERAAKFELELEHIRTENLELQSRVEQERLARIKLEERVAPRVLTVSQAEIITKALAGIAPHKLKVTSILGESESVAFARQLVDTLQGVGLQTQGVDQAVFSVVPPIGVWLVVQDATKVPRQAELLRRALLAANIYVTATTNPQLSPDLIQLVVGVKRADIATQY